MPADTRSTPGSLVVNVTGDESLSGAGFTTSDGWNIRFSRFLVVPGEVKLDGDGCEQYSDNGYHRVLDLSRPGPQLLALVYGLGPCDFSFRVSTPTWDSVLGIGVGERDLDALRTPGTDAHASGIGVSVWIEGTAEAHGVSKRFSWPFRRFIQYDHCAVGAGDTLERGQVLRSGEDAVIELSVRGDALFAFPDTTTMFERFRAADDDFGDADGEVSLDELERVPWTGQPDPEGPAFVTLGEHVYLGVLPRVIRYRGTGECQVRASASELDDEGF